MKQATPKCITYGLFFVSKSVRFLSIAIAIVISFAPPSQAVGAESQTYVPKEIHRLHVQKYINAVAWNADGSRLAALSDFGRTITLWETKHGTGIKEFNRYPGGYAHNSLAFLPDNTLITSAPGGDYVQGRMQFEDEAVRDTRYDRLDIFSLIQWNPEIGKAVRYIPTQDYPPKDLSIKVTDTFTVSKDGDLIAAPWADSAILYDVKDGSMLQKFKPMPSVLGHVNQSMSVAFSPDGKELAVGTILGMVHIYNVKTGEVERSITAFLPQWYACPTLAYSPDGKYLAVGRYNGSGGQLIDGKWVTRTADTIGVKIFNTVDGAQYLSLPGPITKFYGHDDAENIQSVHWSPDGTLLAIGDSMSLRLWKIGKNSETLLLDKRFSHGSYTTAFSPQGLLAANDNNEVVIYQ